MLATHAIAKACGLVLLSYHERCTAEECQTGLCAEQCLAAHASECQAVNKWSWLQLSCLAPNLEDVADCPGTEAQPRQRMASGRQ